MPGRIGYDRCEALAIEKGIKCVQPAALSLAVHFALYTVHFAHTDVSRRYFSMEDGDHGIIGHCWHHPKNSKPPPKKCTRKGCSVCPKDGAPCVTHAYQIPAAAEQGGGCTDYPEFLRYQDPVEAKCCAHSSDGCIDGVPSQCGSAACATVLRTMYLSFPILPSDWEIRSCGRRAAPQALKR